MWYVVGPEPNNSVERLNQRLIEPIIEIEIKLLVNTYCSTNQDQVSLQSLPELEYEQ